MPNWVINKLKVNKRYNEIAELVRSDIADKYGDYEEFDFNKIVPMPKSLNLISGSITNNAIQYALMKKDKEEIETLIKKFKETKCDFYGNYLQKIMRFKTNKETNKIELDIELDMEDLEKQAQKFNEDLKNKKEDIFDNIDYKELGINNFEDLGNTYINNILNYGCDTWYDWSCKNWGTKWNCCETLCYDNNTFEFQTAWACPVPVIVELSKKFADVNFTLEYADEDIGSNCGTIIIENGEIIEKYNGDTDFALDTWGYDKKEYYADIEE